MSHINILQEWYKTIGKNQNCLGIQIVTDTNSGWNVTIDLFDTNFETKEFIPVKICRDDSNWVHCTKENDIFKGYGGAQNLEDILHIFYKWISEN
jgi:hypothetical protein